jgi:hypothetical protein
MSFSEPELMINFLHRERTQETERLGATSSTPATTAATNIKHKKRETTNKKQ